MKRTFKARRPQFVVETLETRTLLSGSSQGMSPPPNPGTTDSVLVRFAANESASMERADLEALRATVVTSYPDGPELIALGQGISTSAAIDRLKADPNVLYATPNSTIHVASVGLTVNDPAVGQLWGLNNSNNVDINEAGALSVTLGTSSTIVAVLDTGIDLGNPDFAGRIWTNPGNDAAAGYPGDIHGWNFINNSPNIQDNDGHGTHVSAVIASDGNNGYGVVGVDPSATIMPLKFLDANGNGSTSDAISAIYFAVGHGAKVINASWGGVAFSQPLNDAIAFANAHNVVFVTAAGNDGTNNDVIPSYPASFRQPNELSVASVDRFGNLPSFSNYGAGTVDLAAPGVDILSDVPRNIDPSGLQVLSGTSMSTAYVSGVAALVAGLNPTLTAAQIVARLDTTTRHLPSLAGKTISGGMVNAYNAILAGPVSTASTATAAGVPSLTPGTASEADVHASILASDEYLNSHGGSPTGFITGLYENVLDREPDPAGLQQWVSTYNSGTVTRFVIVKAFVTSLEARITEVAHWYQDDLGRTTSIDVLKADLGVATWANLMLQGNGDNAVQAVIMTSAEYLSAHGGSPNSIIQGFYQDVTDRSADPSGLTFWAGLLVQGIAPYTVLRDFQGSFEVQETQVAHWFIDDLRRTGTVAQLKSDPGVEGWAGALGNL